MLAAHVNVVHADVAVVVAADLEGLRKAEHTPIGRVDVQYWDDGRTGFTGGCAHELSARSSY
jgi:hypothetical protein